MRRGGSKQKGASFERDVCKRLSLWVSHGEREDLFWRSAMSGGRATLARRRGAQASKQSGDISAVHPMGHALTDHWYIECKHVASLDVESALYTKSGLLAKFWRVAASEAAEHKLMPMIIARQNQRETLMIVPRASLLSPSGLSPFPFKAKIATLFKLECDLFSFDRVLASPFESTRPLQPDYKWLKPGELQRILAGKSMVSDIKPKSLARKRKSR